MGQTSVNLLDNSGDYLAINTDGSINVVKIAIPQTQIIITIPIGATGLSNAIDLGGKVLVGYIMPAAWTAGNMTFQTSQDGINYSDIYDVGGVEISHTVVANHFVRLIPQDWHGVRFIKLRSGTGAVAVNQVASRDIILITKSIN